MILHNPINVLLNVLSSVEIYNAISNLKIYIYISNKISNLKLKG